MARLLSPRWRAPSPKPGPPGTASRPGSFHLTQPHLHPWGQGPWRLDGSQDIPHKAQTSAPPREGAGRPPRTPEQDPGRAWGWGWEGRSHHALVIHGDGAERTGSHPPASTLLHRFKADLGQQLPGFTRAGLGEASKVKDPSKDVKENSHQTGRAQRLPEGAVPPYT